MDIQKASGVNAGTVSNKAIADKTDGKAVADKPAPSAQTVKLPSTGVSASTALPSAAPLAKPQANPLSALLAAAGLPADKLSASIVSFTRFFSLPLKPELLASIRRQGLLAPEDAAKMRETFSLAAAAAESKGLELRPKGLELFAEAINPSLQRRHDGDRSGEQKRGRQDKGQNDETSPKTSPLSAVGLKEMALESAEKDPLLAILNKLPGKNGQRWVVLPFSFCESGRKYRISLRILLETDKNMPDHAVCLAMDIMENGGAGEGGANNGENGRRWSFVLNPDDPAGNLSVYLEPGLPPQDIKQFALELARLMGMPPGNVSVKNRAVAPYEGEDGILRSINEAV